MQLAYGGVNMAPLSSGDHVCWVVDDPVSYATVARALIAEGRALGQKVVVLAPPSTGPASTGPGGTGPGGTGPGGTGPGSAPPGDLAVDPYATFFGQGPLDPGIALSALQDLSAQARAGGYDGLRVISDMDWLIPGRPAPEDIAALEIIVDRAARELGATIICAYRRSSFDPMVVLGALPLHSIRWGTDEGPQFSLSADGASGWRLSGEIDVSVIDTFAAAFAAATSLGDCLVDVSGLKFMDVAGLRAMSQAARRAHADVQLRGTPTALHRLWQLLGPAGQVPELHLA